MTPLHSNSKPAAEPTIWVACLCADWCRACKDYRLAFSQTAQALAKKYPHVGFVWIDVEDSADLVGDLDIETFPTLLVGNDLALNFLGAITPQPEVLARLLDSLLQTQAPQMAHRTETRQIMARLADCPQLWLQTALLSR